MEGFKTMCALFLLVISCTTIQVLADESRMPLSGIMEREGFDKCLKKLGITKEQLQDSLDALRSTQDVSKSNDALCLIKCISEEMGVLSATGELNMAKVKENIPPRVESTKDEFIKCMEKIAKISTCADMMEVFKCMPKMN